MKPTSTLVLFIVMTGLSLSGNAQMIVDITANTNTSVYGPGVLCTNCDIIISPGVTLTINSSCSCNTCTFSGGTVVFASGSSFTLSGVDSFENETVLVNQPFTENNNVTFYGDTVAFNTAMNLSNGRTDLDSSRISVNAALSLNEGTIYKDSLHLNNNLSFTNSVDSFAYSNIDVANGVTISANQSQIINTTFGFSGTASMSVNNGMTSTNSNFYLGGTSTLSSTSSTLSGTSVVMTGTGNSFPTTNALGLTTSNIDIINGATGTVSANSITATGGSIDAATGSTISSTNGITLTNTTTDVTGTNFSGNSLTVSGGSFSATSSTVKSTNAVSFTNSADTLTSSTLTGNSLSTSGGSLNISSSTATITNADNFATTTVTMSGSSSITGNSASLTAGANLTMGGTSSFSVTNAFNLTGSDATLDGNANISSNSMSLSGSSYLGIGDGSLGSTANVTVSNGFSLDATSNLGIANYNNYLYTTKSSLKTNTISCGGGGSEHACQTDYVYGCGTINSTGATQCTVLAVADITLSASAAGSDQVALSWTDNETTTPADHYLVQRSTGNEDWTDIGTVAADGYTAGEYHFTDGDAPATTDNYRIARIAANGSILYSPIASVTITATASQVNIHPNPVIGGTIYITTRNTGEMTVNVYTLTGQLLLRSSLQGQTQYAVRLPSQALSLTAVAIQTIGQAGTQTFIVLVR
jgi:hypothetical protein